jgi:DNA-binding LacI/PurR family transcriptional regulator
VIGLKDVARLAGVSMATVSRVLTRPELVNPATRDRVRNAADALHYRPSRVARRLRRQTARANLLGLIVPDIQNPFFADVVRGVENVAQQHGYMVFLGNSDEDRAKEQRYLELMRAESVDGLTLLPSSDIEPIVAEFASAGIPVVCVDRRLPTVNVDTVIADNVRGAYEAVEHLLRVGHRRIGFLQGRAQLSTSRERRQGYRRALEAAGLEFDDALVREGDSRPESGRTLTHELLTQERPPSALLVGNNPMTLGALEAIHRLGLRIPEDVAIIGYDDMPWALAFEPPLSAVRQPGYEIGRRATELLLQRIADPTRSTTLLLLQPELVVRRSCGVGCGMVAGVRVARGGVAAGYAVLPAPAGAAAPA